MPWRSELAAPFDQFWAGLARYWRKRIRLTVYDARRVVVASLPATAVPVMKRSA